MTADELIQQAIGRARIPLVRKALTERYERDAEGMRKSLAAVARMHGDEEFAVACETNAAIDPEKIARWIELLLKFLPLILLLF